MPFRIPRSASPQGRCAVRIFLILVLLFAHVSPAAAQDSDVYQLLARINALRQQNGLLPLDLSSILTASAQRHSEDMARTGNIDHTGSDGSSIESRIREAGYGHWRDFGVWGENIYGGQTANVDAAWNFWTTSQVHRANLLKPRYREIGIGVARSDNGVYYTLNFGAQPNVLPFFVTGSAPAVTLLLTNENDITTGESVAVMGQATEVRIAEGTDTSAASWQPWAESIPFQLSDTPGPKTISVEYRDELGRGTKMTRTVDTGNLATAAPTSESGVTPTPQDTATSTPATTGTAAATANATVQATTTVRPSTTPTPEPTETLLPTKAPTETATPTDRPTATPTATAPSTPTSSPAPRFTPRPTATPTPRLVAANLATLPAGSRLTPPPPRPAPTERALFAFENAPGLNTFALIIGLQVIVLVLIGAAALVRLRRR